MAVLCRAEILAAPIASKEIEAFGATVRVRALSARSRAELLDAIYANEQAVEAYRADAAKQDGEREGLPVVRRMDQTILASIYALCDEAGAPIFTVDDYDALSRHDYSNFEAIWLAMTELSNRESGEALKKSSGSVKNGGSSSGSRSRSARRSRS